MIVPTHINVKSCARCGLDHEGLELSRRAGAPYADGYDYFATCPQSERNILVIVYEVNQK